MRRRWADLGLATAGAAGWLLLVLPLRGYRTASMALGHVGRALLLIVLVAAALDGLAGLGGHWLLLPLLPAGYGLGRIIAQAASR